MAEYPETNKRTMDIDAAIDWLERSAIEPMHKIHRHKPWIKSAVIRSKAFKDYRSRLVNIYLANNSSD